MSEHGEKSGPTARAAALHRSDRHVQDCRGLGHGIALHVDEYQGCPLVGGELGQSRQELPVEILALGRGLGRLMGLKELFQPLGVVHGRGFAGGGFTSPVQAGIDRDAVQPGGHGGLTTEGVGRPEGGDQRVLNRVGRFLAVAQRTKGNSPEPVAVAPYQLTECMRVAINMSAQEVLVACVAERGVVQR